MSRHEENTMAFDRVLRRVEDLSVANSRLRDQVRDQQNNGYDLARKREELTEARERLQQTTAEIERLKKKHPRLVRLPAFMKPPSDDDIPF